MGDRTNDQPTKGSRGRLIHLCIGPALFLIMLVVPVSGLAYPARCGLGLLLWMSWWWIAGPVDLAVTGFLPLAVAALFNFVPLATVLRAYAEELIILLIGANILTTVWGRFGLDRRIALASLIAVGTRSYQQIMVWFAIATVLSAFLPNTVVAAAMIPIVVAMLNYVGIKDLARSELGTALVLAIAWGTSVGGFATPLGGAPNLLTVRFVQEITKHEFLFMTFVTRTLPLTVVVILGSLVFMRLAFRPEVDDLGGTRSFFREEMSKLGGLSTPEKWGLGLFLVATLLAFTRQLYAAMLPSLTPAYVFLICGLLCFVIRHKGEPLLEWNYAQTRMMWGLFYLFAGGTALGEVLNQSGAAKFVADILVPYASGGQFAAVAVFSLLTVIVTQTTNNTAAIAITVPITISTFQSLGLNPIPYVYIVNAMGNCGFALPSSAGGPAVAAGYGINLRTMFFKGVPFSVLAFILILIVGYLLAVYWPGFGIA